LVDFGVVLIVAVLLGTLTFHRISNRLTGIETAGDVWQILRARGHLSNTAITVASSAWHTIVLYIAEAFAALVIFTFLYQFLTLLWLRRTPGKALMALRVVPNRRSIDGPPGWRRAVATRALVTTTADVGCYAVACCVLFGGQFVLAVLCWTVAVAVFWLNALPALFGVGRSLADRMAGTSVTTVRLPQAIAGSTQAVRQGLQRVANNAVGFGQEAAHTTSDYADKVAQSEFGRTAVEKSRAALGKVRSAAGRRQNQPEPHPPGPPSPGGFGPPLEPPSRPPQQHLLPPVPPRPPVPPVPPDPAGPTGTPIPPFPPAPPGER
jgi:hypothetical protein